MSPPAEDDRERKRLARLRERMVRTQIEGRHVSDPRVLAAMRAVPRHAFVPAEHQNLAYQDAPLPIGAGQTISQPYIVAFMTQLLRLGPDDRVLEIGAGSGYQTAVLAEIVREVIAIERVPMLAARARQRLDALGYENVTIHVADGTRGYADAAPYDGILVAAASPGIPQPLIDQLAEGGRLVIPVGHGDGQMLQLVTRSAEGVNVQEVSPVRFVPLIGEHGFDAGPGEA
jgi:protein-L-isoaspartate(D-aspartate) O-methyltransferase